MVKGLTSQLTTTVMNSPLGRSPTCLNAAKSTLTIIG